MSLQNHLAELKSLLSEEDREIFERLSAKLADLSGDVNQLNEEDVALIALMEAKYGALIQSTAKKTSDKKSSNHSESDVRHQVIREDYPFLKTEFAGYVKDMLLRELGARYPDLNSAICFAYETRWLPSELQNPDVCETLFERFFTDIERANQWTSQFNLQENERDNKSMRVGLTWFIYIYQLKQWTEKYT